MVCQQWYACLMQLLSLAAWEPKILISERGTPVAQVDVYSFSMIAYSLFEHCQPFAGMDPVEAARQSALYDKRPQLMKLGGKSPNMQARPSLRVQGVGPRVQSSELQASPQLHGAFVLWWA